MLVASELSFGEQFTLYDAPRADDNAKPDKGDPSSPRPLPPRVNGSEVVFKALTEIMARIVGPEDAAEAAIAFMRAAPGTVIHIPAMDTCEQLAREWAILTRFRRDPSAEAVQHAASFHNMEVRDTARVFKARNNGRGLAIERNARSTTPGLPCRHPRLNRWRRTITV